MVQVSPLFVINKRSRKSLTSQVNFQVQSGLRLLFTPFFTKICLNFFLPFQLVWICSLHTTSTTISTRSERSKLIFPLLLLMLLSTIPMIQAQIFGEILHKKNIQPILNHICPLQCQCLSTNNNNNNDKYWGQLMNLFLPFSFIKRSILSYIKH